MRKLFSLALFLAACSEQLTPCSKEMVACLNDRARCPPAAYTEAVCACGQVTQLIDMPVQTGLQRDLDILFVIDNSPGVSTPVQRALARAIPQFIARLDALAADYHIGIVTTDVGAYTAPGVKFGGSLPTCESYEGDDGRLQAVPCTDRTRGAGDGVLSQDARDACNELCKNRNAIPTNGRRFIAKIKGQTNLPAEVTVSDAFRCMALVGDAGCGIEGPLEAAFRATDGHLLGTDTRPGPNYGFLRAGSTLAIIFVTDEDDCSVQLARRAETDPLTMECATPDPNAPASCFNPDYRCFARSVQCDTPMNAPGDKRNCKERPDSYLEKVEKYVRHFSGLRPHTRLVLGGIWTLPTATDPNARVKITQPMGATRSRDLNRAQGADATCVALNAGDLCSPMDPNGQSCLYGSPQLRLSSFLQPFGDSGIERSICDVSKYAEVLDSLSQRIERSLTVSCLPGVVKTANGRPVCLVGDVNADTPSAVPDAPFPVCSAGCCDAWARSPRPTTDPMRPEGQAINAACARESATCYCAVQHTGGQGVCPNQTVFGIVRRRMPPPNTTTAVKCALDPGLACPGR